jgi:hypothetical protein
MSRTVTNWGALVAAMVSVLTLAVFVARSVAADETRPVENRVTALEVQRVEDAKKLEEMRTDIKTLLSRTK